MLIQHNYMRTVRKRSLLTQTDIAFILKLSDYSNVSRWEAGLHKPSIEALLVYHLLFETPVESLFERQRTELVRTIIERIKERIDYLRSLESDPKIHSRITYLASVVTRLTS
jgi:transcriptional regulator with XRE-family HTH domain